MEISGIAACACQVDSGSARTDVGLEAGLVAGLKIDVRQAANLPELDNHCLAQALDEMVEQADEMD